MSLRNRKPKSQAISASEANRSFSEVLRNVRQGGSVVVSSHGKAVAKILPVADGREAGQKAQSALFTRLRKQAVARAGQWTRNELYEHP